jgi:hypothetical protein
LLESPKTLDEGNTIAQPKEILNTRHKQLEIKLDLFYYKIKTLSHK